MNGNLFYIWIIGTLICFQYGLSELTTDTRFQNKTLTKEQSSEDRLFEVRDVNGNLMLLKVKPKRLETSIISLRVFDGVYRQSTFLQRSNTCHMTGSIQYVSNSFVSLDVCNELSGILIHGDKVYNIRSNMIFPVQDIQFTAPMHNSDKIICNRQLKRRRSSENITNSETKKRMKRSREEILMIELYVVMDNELFSEAGIGRNTTRAVQYLEEMVNYLDEIYSAVGIRVLLVGIDIWNVSQPAIPASDATELLDQFLAFAKSSIRKNAPVEYDFIALISGKTFGGNHVGMAHVEAMCGDQSGAIIQDESSSSTRELKSAVVLAHEIGHVFGMLHDDAACTCLDHKGCVMNADITQLPTQFSSCSGKTIKRVKETGKAPCLYNVPDTVYHGPICGNGIKERGEVCDCGGPQKCQKSRCCTDTCQLKHGAKCNTGGCCHNCQVVKANKLCRRSQNECDLDEVCDGKGQVCPANLYKQDLTDCGTGSDVGYCYRGQCRSNALQCQEIWGVSGKASDIMCYTFNKRGNSGGNCGSTSKTSYRQCKDSNKMCGMLFCDSATMSPIIGGGTQQITGTTIGQITCKGTIIDLGPDIPDPGMVEDGSPCFINTSAKTKGICTNQICVELTKISIKPCPVDVNGTTCSGKGICNNLDACWCNHGYTGRDCSVKINLEGQRPLKPLKPVHIALISTGCVLFLAGLGVCITFLCYRKRYKEKNKHKHKHKHKEEEMVQSKVAWSNANHQVKKKKSVAFRTTKIKSIPPNSHRL